MPGTSHCSHPQTRWCKAPRTPRSQCSTRCTASTWVNTNRPLADLADEDVAAEGAHEGEHRVGAVVEQGHPDVQGLLVLVDHEQPVGEADEEAADADGEHPEEELPPALVDLGEQRIDVGVEVPRGGKISILVHNRFIR